MVIRNPLVQRVALTIAALLSAAVIFGQTFFPYILLFNPPFSLAASALGAWLGWSDRLAAGLKLAVGNVAVLASYAMLVVDHRVDSNYAFSRVLVSVGVFVIVFGVATIVSTAIRHRDNAWAVTLLCLGSFGVIYVSVWPMVDFVMLNMPAFIIGLIFGLVSGYRLRDHRLGAALLASLAIIVGCLGLWLFFYSRSSYGVTTASHWPLAVYEVSGVAVSAAASMIIGIAARRALRSVSLAVAG